jgi:hypothetical protein
MAAAARRVSLAEYNWVLRVLFPLLQVTGNARADPCASIPPGGLREDFLLRCGYSVYL